MTLEEPENGLSLEFGSPVTLRWDCPYVLQTKEYFRVRIRSQRQNHYYYHREDRLTLPATLALGEYAWTVTTVRLSDRSKYELVGEESTPYRFVIAPPIPRVRSMSPTSAIRGTSVTVVLNGIDLTRSLVVTIDGIPLQTTLANSRTITATIPMTLEVGAHSVILKDPADESVWSASFIVDEPPPPPKPVYPQPQLGNVDIIHCSLVFHWSWTGDLAEDEYFALRVGIGEPGYSKWWGKETQSSWILKKPAKYVWNVAVCRGVPEEGRCQLLVTSELGEFEFRGCGGDRP